MVLPFFGIEKCGQPNSLHPPERTHSAKTPITSDILVEKPVNLFHWPSPNIKIPEKIIRLNSPLCNSQTDYIMLNSKNSLPSFFHHWLVSFGALALLATVSIEPARSQIIEKAISRADLVLSNNFAQPLNAQDWWTNDSRAQKSAKIAKNKMVPQANVKDGVLQIRRTAGSDHAAVARTKVQFQNAVITCKFLLADNQKFSVNINDPNCKTVHAGHLCRVEVSTTSVVIQDQKTGTMANEHRKLKENGASKAELAKRVKGKSKMTKRTTQASQWHELKILLEGEKIVVQIDNEFVSQFSSSGIGHPTKENIAFSVPRMVDIKNLAVYRIAAQPSETEQP